MRVLTMYKDSPGQALLVTESSTSQAGSDSTSLSLHILFIDLLPHHVPTLLHLVPLSITINSTAPPLSLTISLIYTFHAPPRSRPIKP